ncbi:hypothetical protein KLP40_06105 [Hymenobacter sp. NST-14]|uniref:hypothetical protein n=1 Tax=Hymenobacter piscis TaxID=2839984 RepID=UPI001C00DE34|nr:hypothetical protein [Hymenobacter piscis]MBT9392730.1 hypothetical protein [Hymenobacter piscis]
MKRSDYVTFLLGGLLLLASAGLRSAAGVDARWSPVLLLFGSNILTIALVRYHRCQNPTANRP